MIPLSWVTLLTLFITPVQTPTVRFSFHGIGLSSDFTAVAARYPHSVPRDDHYLPLAPEDQHDHISAIEISGQAATRRVRIGFETQYDTRLDYPRCRVIEAKLVAQFGPPQEIRRFDEEASARADRIWTSPREQLTLICFQGADGRLAAEAVLITPR